MNSRPKLFKGQRIRLINLLLERDGNLCFYCHEVVQDSISIEHLHSISNGGRDTFDNLRLTHRYCNTKVGDLSVESKIRIREFLSDRGMDGWADVNIIVRNKSNCGSRRVVFGRIDNTRFSKATEREEKRAESALKSWGLSIETS